MSRVRAELRLDRPGFALEVDLDIPPGGVLALIGPNGSGKSTVLDCVAGLLRPQFARIELGGRDITALPPHQRSVGLLAQDPLLFPHLNVLDNVAFGPRSRGMSRAASRTRAHEWLAEVDATAFAEVKPARLSGGQAQRVSLARALADGPELLLLDEPLAALDVDAAPAMRALLRRVLRRGDGARSAVLVTHDPRDVAELADEVVVLEGGKVAESGPARAVLDAPASAFTARLVRRQGAEESP